MAGEVFPFYLLSSTCFGSCFVYGKNAVLKLWSNVDTIEKNKMYTRVVVGGEGSITVNYNHSCRFYHRSHATPSE